jgi:hypothetical protein
MADRLGNATGGRRAGGPRDFERYGLISSIKAALADSLQVRRSVSHTAIEAIANEVDD